MHRTRKTKQTSSTIQKAKKKSNGQPRNIGKYWVQCRERRQRKEKKRTNTIQKINR
jgi:hypothetical protein